MNERLHLYTRHKVILQELIQLYLPDVEVWVYGSRINGRSHDGSDLDLALRTPDLAEIPIEKLVAFKEGLYQSMIPFLVDAHDWARLPENFKASIEQDHVVL